MKMKSIHTEINDKTHSKRMAPVVLGICLMICGVFGTGCKKLLDIDPPINKTAATTVFSSTAFATEAMTGIYVQMIKSFAGTSTSMSVKLGYTADEMTVVRTSGIDLRSYRNQYTTDPGVWTSLYLVIYRVNAIIDGVKASAGIPEKAKSVLIGEAKFIRAFCYFHLVNEYGDAPLITTSDYSKNINVPRTAKDLVYAQMVQDLQDAQNRLTDDYLGLDLVAPTVEKIRPNKFAATALLARVYLYTGQWAKAETEATKVIDNGKYSLLTDLNGVFLKNSNEAIWQLQPNPLDPTTANTPEGYFLIPLDGGTPPLKASANLLAAMETGDKRRDNWLSDITGDGVTLIPFKYKLGPFQLDQQEYIMVLRLAEQYLIRAEARAQLDKVTGAGSAETDVDAIRTRAGLAGTTAGNKTEMLAEIAKQRFAELFTEWGDRWNDLKRTNKINDVMTLACPKKGGVWDPNKALFPIPPNEFLYNPALRGHQNPGYQEK